MFDLNESIRGWRRRMSEQPDIADRDLDELEDHLRESIAELRRCGVSEEEAYLLAARRLGDPEALAGEFAVANPALRRRLRLRWMVIGALAILALGLAGDLVAGLFTSVAVWVSPGRDLPFLPATSLGWAGGLLRLVILALGAWLIWRVLTSDAAAARVKRARFWSAGLAAAVLVAFLLVAAASTLRLGSVALLSHGASTHSIVQLSLVSAWFRLGLLTLLPVLLVGFLWWLARPRGPIR